MVKASVKELEVDVALLRQENEVVAMLREVVNGLEGEFAVAQTQGKRDLAALRTLAIVNSDIFVPQWGLYQSTNRYWTLSDRSAKALKVV